AGEIGQAGGAALADRVQREVADISLVRPRVVPTGLTEEPILHGALRTALDAVRDEVFGSTVG
ncbi:ROK family transcriptional regulator, partial [Micromonospora azadirachtae]